MANISNGAKRSKTVNSFQLLQKSQKLSATLACATANAPKNFRVTIVEQLLAESYLFTHALQCANQCRLCDNSRTEYQGSAKEHLTHILDLLPVLRNCRLMSPAQENVINTSVYYLQSSLAAWIESDEKRRARRTMTVTNVLLPNTKAANSRNGLRLEKELSVLMNVSHAAMNDPCMSRWVRTCCYIAEEPFSCGNFFLMNYNEEAGRFTFSNSDWNALFGIDCREALHVPHPVYRDAFKCYYIANSISDAIDHYYYKKG